MTLATGPQRLRHVSNWSGTNGYSPASDQDWYGSSSMRYKTTIDSCPYSPLVRRLPRRYVIQGLKGSVLTARPPDSIPAP